MSDSRHQLLDSVFVVAILALGCGLLIYFANAFAGDLVDLDPEGPITFLEDKLVAVSVALMLIVLVPVFSLTVWFVWHYRASNLGSSYAPHWSSHRIELLIWLVPTLIVAVLGVLTWTYTHTLNPYRPLSSARAALRVQVVALDWKWLFIYPDQGIATINQLVIPAQRPIHFDLTSDSVMNSFFIPQLGGQVYAMAGMRTELHLLANHPGKFFGQNTQYSGRGFADQNFEVIAKSQDDFDSWVRQVRKQPAPLNWTAFQQVAKPSAKAPIQIFHGIEPGLFERIIAQYRSDPKHAGRIKLADEP